MQLKRSNLTEISPSPRFTRRFSLSSHPSVKRLMKQNRAAAPSANYPSAHLAVHPLRLLTSAACPIDLLAHSSTVGLLSISKFTSRKLSAPTESICAWPFDPLVVLDWTEEHESFLNMIQWSKLLTVGSTSSFVQPSLFSSHRELTSQDYHYTCRNPTAPSWSAFLLSSGFTPSSSEQPLKRQHQEVCCSLGESFRALASAGTRKLIPYDTPVESLFALKALSKFSSAHTRYRCNPARAELYLSWGGSDSAPHLGSRADLETPSGLIHCTMARALQLKETSKQRSKVDQSYGDRPSKAQRCLSFLCAS